MADTFEDAAALLCDLADAGAALLARPLVTDIGGRREEIAQLRGRLDDFGAGTGRRYLTRFAPLLIQALDRALYFRSVHDAAMAAKFDGVAGLLVAHAREDAAAALAAMREP